MLHRLVLLLITSLFASAGARADAVTILSAASTAGAIEEALAVFRDVHGISVRASFAGSGTLARQIENGAPADLFMAANAKWMDYLDVRDLIHPHYRRDLLANELVLIAPARSTLDISVIPGSALASALGDGRLAMGDPDHVPAGIYAKQALEALGIWNTVKARIAPALDVRGALMLVARGEAVAGIVYRTDAAASREVRVVDAFPAISHAPIVYPLAVLAARAGGNVVMLFDFLTSPEAAKIFRAHGFGTAN